MTYSLSAADADEISDGIGEDFILPDVNDDTEDCNDDEDSDSLAIGGAKSLIFNPIHHLSVWKDPSIENQGISIAILLPTGIGEKPRDLKLSVQSQNILKISVIWPSMMRSVPQLMQRWLTGQDGSEMKDYHPQVQGFYSFSEHFLSRGRWSYLLEGKN